MAQDITSNLLHYYKFDGGAVAVDSGSAAQNGTLFNTTYLPGKVNSGISLNGTSSAVTCPINFGIDNIPAFTIDFWIKMFSGADFACVVSHLLDANNRLEIQNGGSGFFTQNDIGISFVSGGVGTSAFTQAAPLVFGTFHEVGLVFDGSLTGNSNRLKIFIDGLAITPSFGGTIPATTPNLASSTTLIGQRLGPGLICKCILDELRIYNRALTAAQMLALNQSVSFNASSLAGSGAVRCGLSIPNTPYQVFQQQTESPYGVF